MNDPYFEDSFGNIHGQYEAYLSAWKAYCDTSSYNQSLFDSIAYIEPKIQTWQLSNGTFKDRKEAVRFAGRNAIFWTGIKVKEQNGMYFVLYWSDKENI